MTFAALMHPRLDPLSPDETLSLAERAYRRLRKAIVAGSLAAGARISERSLAAALGISAQPVREALRRLEAEGMVVTLPRRGTVIAEFGPERLTDMSRIRIALEGVAAALAARHATEAELEALEAQLATIRAATASCDTATLAEANAQFHGLIHAASGNALLIRSLDALRAYEHFGRLRALASSISEPSRALREHVALLAALRRRDPELAEARMRAHMLRSLTVAGLIPPARRRAAGGRAVGPARPTPR